MVAWCNRIFKEGWVIRLKVLVSAYACEPYKGSEPNVGWNFVKQIVRFHDLWVITRANNRKVIEKELQQNPLPGVTFIYFDLPYWLRFYKRGNSGIYLYYYLWQWGIYRKAQKMHQKVRFDVVHHLTFVNYWMPTFLPLLKTSFVWGPVGGGDITPNSFIRTYSWRGKLYEISRRFAIKLFEYDPFVRMAARQSNIAIAVTEATSHKIKSLGAKHVVQLSQIGMTGNEIDRLSQIERLKKSDDSLCQFVSIGNFLHWKGFHLSLQAFANVCETLKDVEYLFIGNGAERKRLERRVLKLGIRDRVKFLGKIPRHAVLEQLETCNVLMHPSLHDSGAFVCSEAMAAGLPVVCLDLGGPALQVTSETGFKIPAHSPEQVIADMAMAMHTLAVDTDLRYRMGENGRQRVREHFSWEKKGEFIDQLYRQVVPQHENTPRS